MTIHAYFVYSPDELTGLLNIDVPIIITIDDRQLKFRDLLVVLVYN